MNIKELKEKLSKIDFLSTFPFINGYGISTKTDKVTGEDKLVVSFDVSKKIPLEQLNEYYILPKSLSSFGIDIETHVKENAVCSNECDYNPQEVIEYYDKVTVGSISGTEYNDFLKIEHNNKVNVLSALDSLDSEIIFDQQIRFNNPNVTIDPVKRNRQRIRPLSGGGSTSTSGYFNTKTNLLCGFRSGGTLGLFVRDREDRSIVSLSNNHVQAKSTLIGEENGRFNPFINNLLSLSARAPGHSNVNPYGDSEVFTIRDHIGETKRASIMCATNSRNSYADAAICRLSADKIDDSSNSILWFNQKGPYPFATQEEIESLMDPGSINYKSPIFRSGRTLGPLGYPGNLIQNIKYSPNSLMTEPTNLTPHLSTIDGTEITSGTGSLSSIQYYCNGYFDQTTRSSILMQSEDREKVYIVGHRNYYDTSISLLSSLTGTDSDTELFIEDSNKIKFYGIGSANFYSYYVNDNNQIYLASARPCGIFDDILDPYFDTDYLFDWTLLDHQITDITNGGVKKIYCSSRKMYILTEDNKLYGRGGNQLPINSKLNLSFPTFLGWGDSNRYIYPFTKAPGEWKDFITFDHSDYSNVLLGLSATGQVFAAFCIKNSYLGFERSLGLNADFQANFIQDEITHYDFVQHYPPGDNMINDTRATAFSGSYTLENNQIPIKCRDGGSIREVLIKKFLPSKKEHFGSAPQISLYRRVHLQAITEDDELVNITGGYYQRLANNDSEATAEFCKDENGDIIIWNDSCQKICQTRGITWASSILSGGNIYIAGENLNNNLRYTSKPYEDFRKGLAKNTNFPLSSVYTKFPFSNRGSSDVFFKYDNFPTIENKIVAGDLFTYSSRKYSQGLIYSSGSGLSGLGSNHSSIMFNEGSPYRDEVIVANIGSTVNVNFKSMGQVLTFNDTIGIQSKNKQFPVTEAGDSGTAVFAQLSSTVNSASAWKFIGLVFAGPPISQDQVGTACSVTHIQQELNIEPWEGDIIE